MLWNPFARFSKVEPEVVSCFPMLVKYENETENTLVTRQEDLKDKGFKVVAMRCLELP